MSKFKVGDIVQHNYDSIGFSDRSIKIKVEDGEPFDSSSFCGRVIGITGDNYYNVGYYSNSWNKFVFFKVGSSNNKNKNFTFKKEV